MTGVVVAFGAMLLFGTLIGAALAALGTLDGEVGTSEAIQAGIGAGIAFVVAQFLAYLWGGYAAGRMGRGAGIANGLFVALVALLVGALAWAIAGSLGANVNLNLPFIENRLGIDSDRLIDWGVGIGIASVIAMLFGAVLGGGLGARWHTKLERRTLDERSIDLRDEATDRARVRQEGISEGRTTTV